MTQALPVTQSRWTESEIPVECHAEIARAIKHAKKTGQLIIHFSQGSVGAIQWREKVVDSVGVNKI